MSMLASHRISLMSRKISSLLWIARACFRHWFAHEDFNLLQLYLKFLFISPINLFMGLTLMNDDLNLYHEIWVFLSSCIQLYKWEGWLGLYWSGRPKIIGANPIIYSGHSFNFQEQFYTLWQWRKLGDSFNLC